MRVKIWQLKDRKNWRHFASFRIIFFLFASIFFLLLFLSACSVDPNKSLSPIQPPAPVAETEILSVVSYNIQARPVLDSCTWKGKHIGARLNQYDLIGIQETFSSYDSLLEKNVRHGSVYFGKRRHLLKLVNSGLAVFSCFAIEKARAEYFIDEGSLENRLGSKGILMVRLMLNGSVLDFYTTHLAAGTPEVSGKARINELEQIAAFIQKNSPPENAVILCGDFNLTLNSKESELRNFLKKTFLQNPSSELNCEKKTFIDHIFYRSGKKLHLTPVSWSLLKNEFSLKESGALSDHHPLRVEFRLKK